MFSSSVIISAWLGSSSHSCWAASCSLLKVENSWEAAPEIRLSATSHIKWSDLLSFLTKNVHNHDDKCEPNASYLIFSWTGAHFGINQILHILEIEQQAPFTPFCLEGCCYLCFLTGFSFWSATQLKRGMHRGECQHTRFKLDTVLQGETGRSLNCTVTSALMCTLHVSLPQMCSLTLPEYSLNPFNISLLSFFGFFFFFYLVTDKIYRKNMDALLWITSKWESKASLCT